MGDRNTTVQNLEIEKVDIEENVLLVKGAVPGSIGSFVKVTPSIKDGAKLSLEPIVDEAAEVKNDVQDVAENTELASEDKTSVDSAEAVEATENTEVVDEVKDEIETEKPAETASEESTEPEAKAEQDETKKEDDKE